MAKMRGIKPETFTDDKILQLSPLARWLFIGMWTQACDNGHVEANPVQLKVRLLPMDNCDINELINEIIQVGLVERIEGYLCVKNLPKHQKVDRRFLSLCPCCETDEEVKYLPKDKLERTTGTQRASKTKRNNTLRVHDEHTTGTQRVHVDEGEGEGEGEGEINTLDQKSASTERSSKSPAAASAAESVKKSFDEFWETYPRKAGKQKARTKFEAALKRASAQQILDGVHRLAGDPNLPTEKRFIPHPSTWLEQGRWDDEPLPPRFSSTSQPETTMSRMNNTLALGAMLQAQDDQNHQSRKEIC